MEPASFTEVVRQELARVPLGEAAAVRAELAALVRLAGTWHRRGGDAEPDIEVASTSGAVARRCYALLDARYGLRAQLVVRSPGGVRRRTSYGVVLREGAVAIGADLGLTDARGFPVDRLDAGLGVDADPACAVALLRGALLAAGSVSHPRREPHLEIAVDGPEVARTLAEVLARTVDANAHVVEGRRRRVVVKSGETIGRVLAATGAMRAFLEFDDRRLRRQLRGEANRLANADNTNLRRSIEASAAQVATVELAIAAVGWDELDDDLRDIALVRLANPEASLAELGSLVDPPVGKSAVHRRLKRLEALARSGGPGLHADVE